MGMRQTVPSPVSASDNGKSFPAMTLVGVTGGMAAGKSTALSCFKALGASVVDADDVVHGLYLPGQVVYQAVVERWAEEILNPDGTVNRAAIAKRVFCDDREMQWLNDLLHPLVQRQVLDMAAAMTNGVLCCCVPLLFEAGWDRAFAPTVAVWCDPSIQKTRLLSRGWSENDIRIRQARQMTMDEKLNRATYGLINTGSFEMLRQQCRWLYDVFTS
jgi:dephospho-CoA kinase/formamidopyrimidine-DNA glycosylase